MKIIFFKFFFSDFFLWSPKVGFSGKGPPIDFLWIFFRIFSDLFSINSHMGLIKITIHNSIYNEKNIWKNIHRGDPYLKKPTLGDQRKKSEKKNFWKKIFSIFFQIFLSLYFFSIPSGTFSKKILEKFWRKFWENQ